MRSFWIGHTEVTVEQFEKGGGRPTDLEGPTPPTNREPCEPIVGESFRRCRRFMDQLRDTGLRLPNEIEWEYAAAGPRGLDYPWGDEWDPRRVARSLACVRSDSDDVSWCGALDMAGSVGEWCETRWPIPPSLRDARGDVVVFRGGHYGYRSGGRLGEWGEVDTSPGPPRPPSERRVHPELFLCATRHFIDTGRVRESYFPPWSSPFVGFRVALDAD